MSQNLFEKFSHTFNYNNKILFFIVCIFAIQNLLFFDIYKVNYPYSGDISDVTGPVFKMIFENEFNFFDNKGGAIHIPFFPRLIVYPILSLNSFDVGDLFYLQWIVTSITLFVFYLIIKKTDRNLLWTLIPAAAFLYSPLTTSAYWSAAILLWFFPMLGTAMVIYLMAEPRLTAPKFAFAVFFGFLSSFSSAIGIVTWATGIVMILNGFSIKEKRNIHWLIIWTLSILVSAYLYFQIYDSDGYSPPIYLDDIFSYTSYSFITTFLASSFRLKFHLLMVLVGTISVVLSALYLVYFTKSNNLRRYYSVFALMFAGLLSSVIIALGRMNLAEHFGNEPYYSTFSQFFQISLVILSAKLLYEFKKYPKTKINKFIIFFLIIIISSQLVLLIPSYVVGWERGEYYLEEKKHFLSCYSLSPDRSCKDTPNQQISGGDPVFMANYLLEKNYSIFNESQFNEKNVKSLERYDNYEDSGITLNNGKILYINQNEVTSNSKYVIKEKYVQIEGKIEIENDSRLNSMFLIIDDKPFLEYSDFEINKNNEFNWSIFFLIGYLEDGCHSLKIMEIIDQKKFYLDEEIVICKHID